MKTSWSRLALLSVASVLCTPLLAQVTQRVSVDSHGVQASGDSFGMPSPSADGRFVAFRSLAANLVPGDTNQCVDIFVRDRQLGTTERVSVDSSGAQGNGDSSDPSISADGRYVAFWSVATNLVPGDTNSAPDVFVRDRLLGTTERMSIDSGGVQANCTSVYPAISADGRHVAFVSCATNLVPGDTNASWDVFVRHRVFGTTELVSVASSGAQGNDHTNDYASISADGRYVAFESYATNLVPGDTNGCRDVFVRDRRLGTTERVSVGSGNVQGNGTSDYNSISADGRFVAFDSLASNLVPGDTNGPVEDVFVRDRKLGTTGLVSADPGGATGNGPSLVPTISADGRYVAFQSAATNLVPGDTNGWRDGFVRDRQLGRTERVSVDSAGGEANFGCYPPSISADGRCVAFPSLSSNLVAGDTGGWIDIFLHDRDARGFTSLCNPGAAGVIACPCSNPPSGPGRGCDNSSATGGAILTASGVAYLSMDTLAFTTSGEKPTALSIVMQGNGNLPGGALYGQGIRCVGGTIIRRLFIKTASSGSITAPDFGAGDPTVSARSAAKGDVIEAGESRWYVVYYRDPIVLGGCASTKTFNATQTGQVTWSL